MPPGRPKSFSTDEALDTFWARGFEGTSIADLVEATGVGRQSLYDTFGDKHAIFLAALKRYVGSRMDGVVRVLEQPGPAIDNLRNLLSMWRDHHTSCSEGCMLVNSAMEFGASAGDISAYQQSQVRRLAGVLTDTVARAQAEGSISAKTDPAKLAHLLLTVSQGLAMLGRGTTDPTMIRDTTEVLDTLLTA